MNVHADPHPLALVSAFLDGELTSQESALVEAHLSVCASCRELLEDFRLLAASSGSVVVPDPAADLRSRIRSRLAEAERSGRPRFRIDVRPFRLGLAAAAAAVLVIGLWLSRQGLNPVPGALPPAEPPSSAVHEQTSKDQATGGATSLKESSGPAFAPTPPTAAPLGDEERIVQAPGSRAMKKDAPAPREVKAEPATPAVGATGAPVSREIGRADALSRSGATRAEPAAHDAGAPSGEPIRGRSLRFQFPEYTVTLSDDGTLALSSRRYACTVRPETPDADGAVAALFGISARPGRDVREPVPSGATHDALVSEAAAPRNEAESPKSVTRIGETSSIDPGTAVEMGTRLRALLRDRYLRLMDERCGPVPEAVR